MKFAEDIIIKPITTEKTAFLMNEGKYTFEVNKNSTKIEIKKAVEELFNVKVKRVNTMSYKGKKKRVGVHQGLTKAWKKAVVEIDRNPSASKYLSKDGKEVKVNKKYKTEIEELNSVVGS